MSKKLKKKYILTKQSTRQCKGKEQDKENLYQHYFIKEADREEMVVRKFRSFNAKNGWIETISLRQIINFIGQFEHAGQYKKDMCQQIK